MTGSFCIFLILSFKKFSCSLQNATLEDLAERFDINLNDETFSGSYSDKPLVSFDHIFLIL